MSTRYTEKIHLHALRKQSDLNGWMYTLPACTMPLVLLSALQLLSEVNDVEIGVMSWRVVRSLAWENSPPQPVSSASASSPAACLWRITVVWSASRCSGWRLNGFHPAALLS